MFEARPKIGGHCDTHTVSYQGKRIAVDVGAQFFHPDTHPIYVTLLEQVGLYDPAHPNGRETLEAPGSLCIFPLAGGSPIFSSSRPLVTLPRSIEFATFTGSRGTPCCPPPVGDDRRGVGPRPVRQSVVQG